MGSKSSCGQGDSNLGYPSYCLEIQGGNSNVNSGLPLPPPDPKLIYEVDLTLFRFLGLSHIIDYDRKLEGGVPVALTSVPGGTDQINFLDSSFTLLCQHSDSKGTVFLLRQCSPCLCACSYKLSQKPLVSSGLPSNTGFQQEGSFERKDTFFY